MATRTAPTIDGNPTFLQLSVTVYDYTGDQRTDTYQIDSTATPAQIEAFVAALQPLTNGTIWRVTVSDVYNSTGDKNNADELVWENAKDNLVILAKNVNNDAIDFYVPAPIDDMFIDGTEELNPAYGALATWLATIVALKTGFSVISGRLSHRRQVGKKVNI